MEKNYNKYTHTNDLNGKQCYIIRTVLTSNPLANYIEVVNEDGTKEHLFPWEVTKNV
jgi:hypothetical protein